MDYAIFIPGTMGSRLQTPQGDEVWPPTVLETQTSYKRIDQLSRDDLIVTDIVRKVWCVGIYKPLIDQFDEIGFKEGATGQKRLKAFAYDWRKDIVDTADLVAQELEAAAAAGAKSITIIAHSMGGLIARLVLESGLYANKPWFSKITGFIALATPHLGAPLALARVLGLDSALGISGPDFKTLAGDIRYPSGYQLLPAPGEAACWDIATPLLEPLDIYDRGVAKRLGLNTKLLDRARFVHDTLAKGSVPKHVRYFFFAGTGHDTVTRINMSSAEAILTTSDDAGDGTVPMWSALPRSLQKQLVVGDHSGFFTGKIFSAVFYRLLGATFPTPPIGLTATGVFLSAKKLIFRHDEAIALVLVPDQPSGEIKGSITIERADNPSTPFAPFGAPIAVSYSGPETEILKMALPPTGKTGQFKATFHGKPGGSQPVFFAVSDV